MVATLAIGFQTPPLGENLFVASGIGGSSIEDISVQTMPFSILAIIAVFIIAFFPQISLLTEPTRILNQKRFWPHLSPH